ncbi:MAG: winged helix-turn-helix domain-containing protein [Myxococcota bacterium]
MAFPPASDRFLLGAVRVDLDQRSVQPPDREGPIRLTGLEARLLSHLVRVAPAAATHQELLEKVWQVQSSTQTQAVPQAIRRLRTKLEPNPSEPKLILSEAGVGYRLSVTPRAIDRSTLPIERDVFFGRLTELDDIERWWREGHRLITVTGFGGIGKTRLAMGAARGWPGLDAWFVDLSPARTQDDVVRRTASALGIRIHGPDSQKTIGVALRDGLIVLDNAEHVLDAVQSVVDQWLELSRAHFMVTSRHRLALPGEKVLRLGPLESQEARQLWLARVPRGPSTQGDSDDDLVLAITERLEGIPLAIELAAARRASLSTKEILTSLSQSERPRAGRHHRRQGTLARCIGWSWDLLSPAERTVLAQCGAFRGGFTVQAAEAVVQRPSDGPPLRFILASLVDQSLLRADTRGEVTRYRLYAVLAEFVRHAQGVGDAELRHAEYYASRCHSADPHANSTHFARLIDEVDDLSAALDVAIRREKAQIAFELTAGLVRTVAFQQPRVVLDSIRRVLPLADSNVAHRAELMLFDAGIQSLQHRLEVAEHRLHDVLSLPVEAGIRGRALIEIGNVDYRRGRYAAARGWYEEAIAMLRHGAPGYLGAAVDNVARMDALLGDFDRAMAGHSRARELHRQHGRIAGETRSIGNLGALHYRLGNLEQAAQLLHRSAELGQQLSMADNETLQRTRLAHLCLHNKKREAADKHAARAVSLAVRLGSPRSLAYAWHARAKVDHAECRSADVDRGLSTAHQAATTSGNPLLVALVNLAWAEVYLERTQLDSASRHATLALEGLNATPDPLDRMTAWALAGRIDLARGHFTRAQQALANATAEHRKSGHAQKPEAILQITELRKALASR